jgi:hypothetical protein
MKPKNLLLMLVLFCFYNCKSKEEQEAEDLNCITEINLLVDKIEAAKEKMQRIEILSKDLNSGQIRQKWSKVHFYLEKGKVCRIKTYPHEENSKLTDEFYFDNDQLVFAILQDNGDQATGNQELNFGRMYYFKDDELVKEVIHSEKKDHELKSAESKRLLKEANEYLELLKNNE